MSTDTSPKNPETSELARIGCVVAAKNFIWDVLPLVIVDTQTGEIVEVTQQAAELFSYTVKELLGQELEILIPEELRPVHVAWRIDPGAPKNRMMGLGRKVHGRKKDGTTFPCHVGITVMTHLERQVAIAFVVDLTSVQYAEQVLAQVVKAQAVTSETKTSAPTHGSVKLGMLLAGFIAVVALLFLWKILAGGDFMDAQEKLYAAIKNMRAREYQEAAVLFAKAAEEGADPVLSLGGAAECFFYLKQDGASLDACDRLSRAVPNCGRAAHIRGLVFRRQGKTEEALHEFRWAARTGHIASIAMLRKESQ